MQHRGDNIFFLAFACQWLRISFFCPITSPFIKAVELTNPFIYFIFFSDHTFSLRNGSILRGRIISQKTVIDKSSSHVAIHSSLLLTLGRCICFRCLLSASPVSVGTGLFSGTVVAYQAQHVTALDGIVFYICGYFHRSSF